MCLCFGSLLARSQNRFLFNVNIFTVIALSFSHFKNPEELKFVFNIILIVILPTRFVNFFSFCLCYRLNKFRLIFYRTKGILLRRSGIEKKLCTCVSSEGKTDKFFFKFRNFYESFFGMEGFCSCSFGFATTW